MRWFPTSNSRTSLFGSGVGGGGGGVVGDLLEGR